jgi:hypothetical protein
MAPPCPRVIPLTPDENIRLDNLITIYGPDMVQWLRTGFGSTCATIADMFELQNLSQAGEIQAATALAAGNPSPAANARLVTLRAVYTGQPFVDLCQIKALTAAQAGVPPNLEQIAPSLPSYSSLIPKKSDIAIEKITAISRYRKLTSQSKGWLLDILSDANGVSFHRFQLFSWTLILGGVFAVTTYGELNMPGFDTTLMGLLGLSAATYLGLKVPEPSVPPK